MTSKEYKKKLRDRRKKLGICIECNTKAEEGYIRCAKCNELHKKYQITLRQKRKKHKKCTRCGKPLLERMDITKCNDCTEYKPFWT